MPTALFFRAGLIAALLAALTGCGGGSNSRGNWPNNNGWPNNNNQGGSGNGQVVRCESNDGQRHRCNVGFKIGGAEVDKRLSDARCQRGQAWGYDGKNLWVDRGCRADFRVYRR
jgi:hypothetical protein